MKRYDFERYEKSKKHSSENRYYIIDRQAGTTIKIATVYDVDDAHMIVNALNGEAKWQSPTRSRAEPTPPNSTSTPQREI